MSKDKTPHPNSTEGKRLEKIVSHNPFLRKMRAQSRGEKYSEISIGGGSEQFKENYDKIDFTKRDKDAPKSFRVKINGKYVDEQEDE